MERNRWLLIVAGSLVGGFAAGVLGTLVHQGIWRIGSFSVPWGLVLGFALVLSFLLGLRLANESRWPSVAGLVGVFLATMLFIVEAPNGSVLIPANLWGTIWSATPGIIGAVIVAWPRLKRAPVTDAN